MDRFTKREFLVKWAPLLVLFILILFFTLVEPRFLSVRNLHKCYCLDPTIDGGSWGDIHHHNGIN